jgi:hypothetical protein
MATTSWQLSGDFFETCSCDFLCPCLPSNLAAQPTKGHCNFAMVFHIDQGRYGNLTLDGLNFAVVGHTPTIMGQGNWSVGLILDERATADQQQALTAIASGQAGGPMAPLGALIGTFLGAEVKPIDYQKNALQRSVTIPGLLDQTMEGLPSAATPGEPLHIDNTIHPANSRLALGRATQSHLHVFGLDWDETNGQNNGHFAPFHWQN